MKKVRRNLFIIILILKITAISMAFLVIPKMSYATESTGASNMSEDELRSGFVSRVVNFVNTYGRHGQNVCIYPEQNITYERKITYEQGSYGDGTYHFDCVGWVSYAIHHFLGLGPDTYTNFVSPGGYLDEHFERTDLGTEKLRRYISSISKCGWREPPCNLYWRWTSCRYVY